MGKSFSQTLAEMYKPKSKSEQDFVDKHKVVTKADAAGNGDDVFKASNIKKDKSKKDPTPEEQEKMYEDAVDEDTVPLEAPKVKQKVDKKHIKHEIKTEDVKAKYSNSWKTALSTISENRLDEAAPKLRPDPLKAAMDASRKAEAQKRKDAKARKHADWLKKNHIRTEEVDLDEEFKVGDKVTREGREKSGTVKKVRGSGKDQVVTVEWAPGKTVDYVPSHSSDRLIKEDLDLVESDDGVASDLDREIIEATLRSASFKLDFVHSLVEDDEIEIPLYMKHTVTELKLHIDALYSEVNVLLSQYEDAEEHVGSFVESLEALDEAIQDLEELSRDKLKDYANKSRDHSDKLNKEINTTKDAARVANIRKNSPTIKKRDAGRDRAYAKLQRSPNAKVHARNEEVEYLDEATMKLSKNHIVHFDNDSKGFASLYTKGNLGDHREGGPKDSDEKWSDKLWSEYDVKQTRSGFAGSGTTIFTSKKTGDKYQVERSPNGKGFHGTDHTVTKLKKDVSEDADLDENLGKGLKKMKFWYKGLPGENPRDLKKTLKTSDPDFVKKVANNPKKLKGAAELQRRLAKKMTKEDIDLVEELIDSLSEENKKKAQELAKTEEGLKKLLDFIKKNEME